MAGRKGWKDLSKFVFKKEAEGVGVGTPKYVKEFWLVLHCF